MFSGESMRSITEGLDGEVWAVSENGRELHVSDGGKETDLKLDWLGAADSIVHWRFLRKGADWRWQSRARTRTA